MINLAEVSQVSEEEFLKTLKASASGMYEELFD